MPDIEWRPCQPPFHPDYEVSNQGDVRLRISGDSFEKCPLYRCPSANGRVRVFLKDRGQAVLHYVHHLVAASFLAPSTRPPSKNPRVYHINGDRSDNRVENLTYDPQARSAAKPRSSQAAEPGTHHRLQALEAALSRALQRLAALEAATGDSGGYDYWPELADLNP